MLATSRRANRSPENFGKKKRKKKKEKRGGVAADPRGRTERAAPKSGKFETQRAKLTPFPIHFLRPRSRGATELSGKVIHSLVYYTAASPVAPISFSRLLVSVPPAVLGIKFLCLFSRGASHCGHLATSPPRIKSRPRVKVMSTLIKTSSHPCRLTHNGSLSLSIWLQVRVRRRTKFPIVREPASLGEQPSEVAVVSLGAWRLIIL